MKSENFLFAHDDLQIHTHTDEKRTIAILGVAVDERLCSKKIELDAIRTIDEAIQHTINLAGYYVVVFSINGTDHILTDPGGMMGVYYKDGEASSSINLLKDVRRDSTITDSFHFRDTDDWYTGSTTPFVHVKYLLANHVLNLETNKVQRFWPTFDCGEISHHEGVQRCCEILKHAANKYVEMGEVLVSLTGGRDSRVNLASMVDHSKSITTFTLSSPKIKNCDIEIPKSLAALTKVNHLVIPIEENDIDTLNLYDEISGGLAIGARREVASTCKQLSDKNYIHISGNLGAITKSFFWHNKNPKSVKVSALLKEFIAKPPCIIDGANEWLKTVPTGLRPTFVYNLMYLEQRGGRWMGPGENASSLFYQPTSLFCSRRLTEIACSMPTQTQVGGQLLEDLASALWPEVGEHSYCKNTRGVTSFIPRGLKNFAKKKLARLK
ncbi:hypothetical protein QEH56_23230 [Pelagicoccus enzymogenes]|uniref:hypothetical protein n=1 Tax=Pelagicoccus enzymogenes TaxID=2773457 RepID=UPI0028107132|nr:hypothetical protein [Pelagicoccus enzymogenes]MDQ8201098.1 hypothetical protein [Pelagicoccus enzymogenes]